MNAARPVAWACFLCVAGLPVGRAQTIVWTGVGPTGWQGGVALTSNPSAQVFFFDAVNLAVPLPGDLSLNGLFLESGDNFTLAPAAGATLPLNLSLPILWADSGTDAAAGRLQLDPNINVSNLLILNVAHGGEIIIPGHITSDLGGLTLQSDGTGGFVFNNVGAGNSYAGPTYITGVAGAQTVVAFWNSSPFGLGSVNVSNSAEFIAHGTQTLANAFTFGTTVANDPIFFKSWDAPLTLTGAITLAGSTTINAQVSGHFIPSADNSGVFLSPGSGSRNPIIFSGNITETGGSQSLTVKGPGVVLLTGTGNTYSGGTTVNGSLVFTPGAIPATGSVTVNSNGYVGVAAPAAGNYNIADFNSLLAVFNVNSTGTIGIDTLPGNTTTILTSPITLSGGLNAAISLGTATSAILQGTIVPQGQNYQFGNGGGSLFVQSNLVDINAGFAPPSKVVVTNAAPGPPLKLYLQGTNIYTGGTVVNDSFAFFDGSTALPAAGLLTAGGSALAAGQSYVGYTDSVTAMTPAGFLAKFDAANTWGIIGFDAHSTGSPVTINNPIDLTGFNDGVFLGSATNTILAGSLTPSTVANGSNAPNTLRFTAALGGTLTVTSTLADLNGGTTPLGVMLGVSAPLTAAEQTFSDGTVVINPASANTYSGGTTLNTNGPLTLSLAGVTPLGTGPLTVVPNGLAPVGLSAGTAGFTLANNVVLQSPNVSQTAATLYLTGNNGFALAGNISGSGDLVLSGTPGLAVTLSGNNSAYSGGLDVWNGTLTVASNAAAGTGVLTFDDPAAVVALTSSAPTLFGIHGDYGNLQVANGSTLSFDLSNPANDFTFGGTITGPGGSTSTGSVVVTATQQIGASDVLYLHGANNYSGGTTITNYGLLGIGNNQSLGTGTVTLNSSNGGLAVNQGITLSNPLIFTAGSLAGYGTFAPSNLTNITFGLNQDLIPGLPGLAIQAPGTLNFQTNLTFANGGVYEWALQDNTRPDGFSLVTVQGNLNITATGGGFILDLVTVDSQGKIGPGDFDPGSPGSWILLQTTGTVTGFSPSAFTIISNNFQSGLVNSSEFSLTLDGTGKELLLDFAPVPEPPTWLLLGSGAGLLGWFCRRRRR
jgi:autotransporter-associated beta strand protein